MISTTSPTRRALALGGDVVAQAVVRATAAEIPALRKSPGAPGGPAVAPSVLRHVDEQTVAGASAVLRAVHEWGLDPAGFADWGVVAAPRFLGRSAFESAFPQFQAEGAWGVSPLLIANHSLHSISGTVSQVLKAHGPNLGVGGAPGGEAEAFLAAAMMLHDGSAPGVWVVLTGWTPGWDGGKADGSTGVCEALALALRVPEKNWKGTRLWVAPGSVTVEDAGSRAADGSSTRWRVDAGEPRDGAPHLFTSVDGEYTHDRQR